MQGQLIHKNLGIVCIFSFISYFRVPSPRPLFLGKHKKARSAFADKHYDIALRNSEGARCHSHELCARSRHPPKHSPKIPEERWLGSLSSHRVTFPSKVGEKRIALPTLFAGRPCDVLYPHTHLGLYLGLRCCTFSLPFPSPSRLRRRDVRGAPKVDDDVVLWSSITAAAAQPRRSPILPTSLSW